MTPWKRRAASALASRLPLVLALIPAWLAAPGGAAQVSCEQRRVLNKIAVEIVHPGERIPDFFHIVNDGTARRLRIPVTRGEDGLWACEDCEPLRGSEHSLRPEIEIPGYSIPPVTGANRPLQGECYAYFRFKPKKVFWALEVSPKPPFPFEYNTNGGGYSRRSPSSGDEWKTVDRLSLDDVVQLKIFELEGDDLLFLFSLEVLPSSGPLHHDADTIADKIIQERTVFWPKPPPDASSSGEDPYLEILRLARMSRFSEPSSDIVRRAVKHKLKLRSLELRDTTESPR